LWSGGRGELLSRSRATHARLRVSGDSELSNFVKAEGARGKAILSLATSLSHKRDKRRCSLGILLSGSEGLTL
jgi:hypothetical protein